MLADAEMQVPAAVTAGLEIAGSLERQERLVGRAEIRRSAEQPWDVLREHVEHFARRVPSGDSLGIGGENGESEVPSARQLAPLHPADLCRQFGIYRPVTR